MRFAQILAQGAVASVPDAVLNLTAISAKYFHQEVRLMLSFKSFNSEPAHGGKLKEIDRSVV